LEKWGEVNEKERSKEQELEIRKKEERGIKGKGINRRMKESKGEVKE